MLHLHDNLQALGVNINGEINSEMIEANNKLGKSKT